MMDVITRTKHTYVIIVYSRSFIRIADTHFLQECQCQLRYLMDTLAHHIS